MARPSPDPWLGPGAADERLEDLAAPGRWDAGPGVRHANRDPSAPRAAAHPNRGAVGGELHGVFEQVGEHALELGDVGADQRQVGGEVQLDPMRPEPLLDLLRGAAHRVGEIGPVRARVDRAGLDPRQVEQVVDHPGEASGLGLDRLEEPVVVVGREAFLAESARGGGDRRQRRAEIVGDRVEQRGLRRIGTPGRLRRRRALGQELALAGEIDEASQRLRQALEAGAVPAGVRSPVEPSRARGRDPHRELGGLGVRRGGEPGAERGRPGCTVAIGQPLQLRRDVLAREERGGRLRQDHRLPLAGGGQQRAALGLSGLRAGGGREPSHHQRHHEEDPQGDDVVRVGDRQPVAGLDEEEVERQDAQDGGGQRGHLAAADGDEQDGEDVEDAEPGDRRDLVEEGDDAGDDRYRGDDLRADDGDRCRLDAMWTLSVHRPH